MQPEHWVVLPTYNEAENIRSLLRALLKLPLSLGILVVDDNSPDGTADLVERFKQEAGYPYLFVLRRPRKEGLGKAYEAGFHWVLSQTQARFIYEMDADFSHPPEYLPHLAEALAEYDLAVGSRYIQGINVINWPLSRILLSYGASWYVRWVTGMPVRDPTAGFVGYTRKTLERILSLGPIRFKGYAFQIEMKYKAFVLGARIVEVPIVFVERVAGRSKMSHQVIQEAIWGVLWLRWRRNAFRKAVATTSEMHPTPDSVSAPK